MDYWFSPALLPSTSLQWFQLLLCLTTKQIISVCPSHISISIHLIFKLGGCIGGDPMMYSVEFGASWISNTFNINKLNNQRQENSSALLQ